MFVSLNDKENVTTFQRDFRFLYPPNLKSA